MSDKEDENERGRCEIIRQRENIWSLLSYTNATPIQGHWGLGYACYYCPKQFKHPADLKQHTYTHGDLSKQFKVSVVFNHVAKLDMTDLKCNVCEESIDHLSLEEVLEHLIEHGKPAHVDIKNHILPFKFDSEELKCVICYAEFSYFKLLSSHMSEHYKNYICKVCGRGFINKHARKAHTYRHKDEGVYPCRYCDKEFATKLRQLNHERVVHILQNKTQRCGYCSERFVDVVKKSNHEFSVHGVVPRKFHCYDCGKIYDSQRSLSAHYKCCHLKLKPHKCTECSKAFWKKSGLTKHMVTHTKERNYECDKCGKSFGTGSTLKQHMKIHDDLKRFACAVCGATFVFKSGLKYHMTNKHNEDID